MAAPAKVGTVYATDENIAIRAAGDFATLCPDWQKLAHGVDGEFQSTSRWTLRSVDVDFAGSGVRAQHVVHLRKPSSVFKGGGELLAVDTVEGSTITLRRLGQDAGVGQPPGPASGVSGVEFLIATLDPQIEEASYQLNRRFHIDPAVAGRSPGDLHDLRDLRYATVLSVLAQRYGAEARDSKGDFVVKFRVVSDELMELLARLTLRWNPPNEQRDSNWFCTRVVR
jgi:hypothetical protein